MTSSPWPRLLCDVQGRSIRPLPARPPPEEWGLAQRSVGRQITLLAHVARGDVEHALACGAEEGVQRGGHGVHQNNPSRLLAEQQGERLMSMRSCGRQQVLKKGSMPAEITLIDRGNNERHSSRCAPILIPEG